MSKSSFQGGSPAAWAASSSISHAMLSTCPTAPEHIEEHSATGKALTHWRPAYAPRPDLPVFTYVRHPIDKFTSYYRDKFLGARESGFELAHLRRLGFDPHMSIDEVVEHMLTIPVGRMEHHAQPQHRIIAPGGALLSSFTGSVEAGRRCVEPVCGLFRACARGLFIRPQPLPRLLWVAA